MGALIKPTRRIGIIACATVILALSACQHGGGGFCDIARPLRPSEAALAAMTPAEVADMLGHNQKGERLCGWTP